MRRLLAGVLVVLGLQAAPAAALEPRIVGGTPAAAGDLPSQVGLLLDRGDGREGLCGGTLVAARWVVTAAHCIASDPVDMTTSEAVIGATDLNAATPEQRFPIAAAFFDPAYPTGGGGHDVGLVRLARPATATPMRLPRPGVDDALWGPGTAATVAGWGLTEDPADGGQISLDQLRRTELRMQSDADCRAALPGATLDFDTEVCALAPDTDACSGDSGGPLAVRDPVTGEFVLAGAVSFGIVVSDGLLSPARSCNEGLPGVYARLGGPALNGFVRANVPQVELDTAPAAPGAGTRVFFTARPNAPGGTGPFGGYDALAWDLDGDGAFDDAADRLSVARRFAPGRRTVGVLATTAAGDREARRIVVDVGPRTTVGFATPGFRARAGRPARVVLRREGPGTGTVRVRARGRGARPFARTVRFTGGRATVRLRVPTRRRGGPVRLRLTRFTGALTARAGATTSRGSGR